MNISDKFSKLLQLAIKEKVLLKTLSEDGMLLSEIVLKSKLPRMTIYPFLSTLKNRGLVNYKRIGKRKYWYTKSPNDISNFISETASEVSLQKVEVAVKKTSITVHRNIKSIYSIFEQVAHLRRGERVWVIQPTLSMLSCINNLRWQEEIKPLNEKFIENGILIESLLQDNYFTELYKNISQTDPQRAKEHIESFIGRSNDAVFISKEYLNTESEFLMFRDKAFVINWSEEVAVEIKNEQMILFLRQLFELARGYGKKIDLNQYLKDMLLKINTKSA